MSMRVSAVLAACACMLGLTTHVARWEEADEDDGFRRRRPSTRDGSAGRNDSGRPLRDKTESDHRDAGDVHHGGNDRLHHDHGHRNSMASSVLLDMGRHPYAKCLDGTPGGYFLLPGDPSEFVIHLEGGGECVDESYCLARAGSALGSSNYMPPKLSFNAPGSLVDTNLARNERLSGATMVRVHYCSGDMHSGETTKPSRATFGLWFSGFAIVKAVLEDLVTKHHLGKAKLIVWTGSSAGGVGSVLSLDYVSDTLKAGGSNAQVVGAPLAGFYFLNLHPYRGFGATPYMDFGSASVKKYTELWNSTLPKRCTKEYNGTEWLCLFSNFSASTLKTDVMFFAAQTDLWVLLVHNGIPGRPPFNPWMEHFVRGWAGDMRKLISSVARPGVSVFNPACWTHTYFEGVHVKHLRYQDAFAQFLELPHRKRSFILQDNCTGVSCNHDCAKFFQA